MVDFINWQADVINDPLFGDILDVNVEGKWKSKINIKKSNPKSSFATSVSLAGGQSGAQQPQKRHHGPVKPADAFQSPCMYCKKNHALEVCEKIKEQTPKDRIKFLITKGLCFGCLTQGHMSKDCRKRMQCRECSAKHPSILHVIKDTPAPSLPTERAEHESSRDTGAGNYSPHSTSED